jgi:hypothetical protein
MGDRFPQENNYVSRLGTLVPAMIGEFFGKSLNEKIAEGPFCGGDKKRVKTQAVSHLRRCALC